MEQEEIIDMIEEYIENAIHQRNNNMYKGAFLSFIYYQGLADGLSQLAADMEYKPPKQNNKREVT